MNPLEISAVVLIASGLIYAVISLKRYSDFLARLHVVNSSSVEKWTIDWKAGENWSNKNFNVAKLFWRCEYLSIADGKLANIGSSVRKTQITSFGLVFLGLLLLAFKGVFE